MATYLTKDECLKAADAAILRMKSAQVDLDSRVAREIIAQEIDKAVTTVGRCGHDDDHDPGY